jgi:hypothetical protein
MNTVVSLRVEGLMKPALVLAVGFAALLTACAPPSHQATSRATEEPKPGSDRQAVRRATRNMASLVADLQATSSGDHPGASQSAGNLWVEVGRLKRGGQNVRQIEWYVSDLEGSLRRGQQDASARRHILNNLSYEIAAFRQRHR